MPHRVAFLGFGDFERKALASYFRLAHNRTPAYEQVGTLTDADFLVADADHAPSVALVEAIERLGETVFIGTQPPENARSWLARPIDALHVMRALDALVAQALAERAPRDDFAGPSTTIIQLARHRRSHPEADDGSPLLGDLPFSAPAPQPEEALQLRAEPLPVDPAPGHSLLLPAEHVLQPAPDLPAHEPPLPMTGPADPVAEAEWLPPPPPLPPPLPPAALVLQPAAPRPPKAPKAPKVSRGPQMPATPRVLLVDDSAIALRFMETRLSRWQLQIDQANSSQAAMALLAQHSYEVVFLDVELGEASELDGHALCQRIKHTPALMSTMVIIVSAHHSELDRVRAALAGCDAFLAKPLDLPELQRLLDRHGLPLAQPSAESAGAAKD
jgi:CheY-like chemotaxis protein